MNPIIKTLAPKKLIGISKEMSLSENKTAELWKQFMPRRGELENRVNSSFISMQVYDPSQETPLSPSTLFQKWAAAEVVSLDTVPSGMEPYELAGGLYAKFIHKGIASSFPLTMQIIFGQWLPASEYEFDSREQFEILPANYSPIDPDSEEEVWIPIKRIS